MVGSGSTPPGVYQIPAQSSKQLKMLGATEKSTGSGVLCNDIYYVHTFDNSMSYYGSARTYAYATDSWTQLNSVYISGSPGMVFMASDYAVEPGTDRIFGCAPNTSRDGFELNTYEFDYVSTNSERTMVAQLATQLGALAFDRTGQLYGLDQEGVLYKVDKTTGALTKVGATSVAAKADGAYINYIHSSAVIDSETGKMYWSVTPPTGACALYEVNLANATATKLRDFDPGIEVTGLCIMEPEAADGAPGAATNLSVSFPGTSLDGIIEFKAPGVTYGGDNLEEDLRFRVLANDVEIYSGRVYAKATKSQPISVAAPGMYEFKVICSNAQGAGPAAKLKATVGYPAPAAPVVSATATSSAYSSYVEISWLPVTETADGSDLGDLPVTYRVVRYPDEKVITESTSSTSVYDWSPESGQHLYQYGVTAIANDTPSEEGYSPKVVTGLAPTPYQETFADENVTDFYTIVDANNDARTWLFYSGDMASEASPDHAGDDWLITPAIDMRSNRFYKVSIDVRARSSQAPGKFEVKFGNAPTAEAMTTAVVAPTEVVTDNGSYETYSGLISTGNSYGPGHIGVHAIT
ncbi:MAG: DUF4394 domain-containing protein, partial [Muribaculaceae bacterium]|nr:DUF4394 domain-containing protein [Muribaculaceae bacterium]